MGREKQYTSFIKKVFLHQNNCDCCFNILHIKMYYFEHQLSRLHDTDTFSILSHHNLDLLASTFESNLQNRMEMCEESNIYLSFSVFQRELSLLHLLGSSLLHAFQVSVMFDTFLLCTQLPFVKSISCKSPSSWLESCPLFIVP